MNMAVEVLLAPNPGPMTLEGTNTYLLGEPRVVVDPGPADPGHLDAIVAAAPAGIAEIWLTHHHADHLAAVPALAERTGALVRSWWPPDRLGIEVPAWSGLADGEELLAGEVRAVHLPGHTSDSVGFVVLGAAPVLLTGDMVLGRGTTVIAHPDGDLAAYFASLARMRALAVELGLAALLPGHGPAVADAVGVLDFYRDHRLERLAEVRRALATADTPEAVTDAVYRGIDPALRPAALRSVRAQLAYLSASGR